MFTRTPVLRIVLGVLALTLSTSACDKAEDDPAEQESVDEKGEVASKDDGKPGQASEDAVVKAVEDKVAAELSDEARFEKDMRKQGCELLTAKLVADTFGAPEADLRQTKVMGCIYSWSEGDQMVEAQVMMLRAHKSEKSAARWFGNATRSVTKEEVTAMMETVKEKAKEREEIDTKLKKKTTDQLADVATGMIADEGIQYEDLEGVGEQARVNVGDGSIWVRVDNLTFTVSAYKGKTMTQPHYASMKPKQIIAASTKASKEWMKETAPQRTTDSTTLAKLIVAALN
jgi:hypothetical protein